MQKVDEKTVGFVDNDDFYHRFKIRLLKAKRRGVYKTEVTFWIAKKGDNLRKVFNFMSDGDCFEELVDLLSDNDMSVQAAAYYVRNIDKTYIKIQPRFLECIAT